MSIDMYILHVQYRNTLGIDDNSSECALSNGCDVASGFDDDDFLF